MTRRTRTRLGKGIAYGALLSLCSAVTLVAQDAMVVGGSSLPPGAAPVVPMAPAAAPTPSVPAASPFAPRATVPDAHSPNFGAPGPVVVPAISQPSPLQRSPLQRSPLQPTLPQTAPAQGLPAFAQIPDFSDPTYAQPAYTDARDAIPTESRGYYPGRDDKRAPALRGPATYRTAQVSGGSSLPPGQAPRSGGTSIPPTQAPVQAPRSWSQKLGLGNISTRLFGHARAGAAARDIDSPGDGAGNGAGNGWEEAFALDGYVGGEVSAVTPRGIEYGVNLGLRGTYNTDGPLYGGGVGACPVGAVCPGQLTLAGTPYALRGHSSQLFLGTDNRDEARLALESAHLFLRSGYGDLTVGRDAGAAELFSLSAPSVLPLSVADGRADFTSLSVAKSINDPTAFAEKLSYTSPRLGGDRIGFGAQFGASYTPDVDACGGYQCIRRNGSDASSGSLGAVLEDAFEVGISLDRTVALAGSPLKAELTGTYATASSKASESLAAFDDLQAWSLGTEISWNAFRLGGGYLQSNNALVDGDWRSWDLGLAWERGVWGASLGYAFSEDDNVGLTADEYSLGLTRAFGDIKIGAGVQHVRRDFDPARIGTTDLDDEATSVFIETGWTFE